MSERARFSKSVGSLDSVGSRVELERFSDDVRFAKDACHERLQQASSSVHGNRRMAESAQTKAKSSACIPAASAASVLLSSASDTTSDIKSRIDDVSLVYERCRDAKRIVDQVIELRDCLQGCHIAMEVKDWERAATLASRALAVPEDIATSEFAQKMVPSAELPDLPLVTLKAACDDLANLFSREFNKATQSKQMDQVSFYFKSFPLVGHNEMGLKAYARFISQAIAGIARNVLQTASSKTRQNATFYSAVLTNLFENIAAMVNQHTPIVRRHYGQYAMVEGVMPILQIEVDKQAGSIIDTFWDERRMEMLVNSIKAYTYPGLANAFVSSSRALGGPKGANTETPVSIEDAVEDLQEASARLSEIGTMLNRWKLYVNFVTASSSDENGEHAAKLTEVLKSGSTSEKIDNLLGPSFSVLALFVCRRSVERAVKMDELPSKQQIEASPVFSLETPLSSSMVDDFMYVFNQVLSQIVETGHESTMTGALIGIRRVLDSDLIGTLQRNLQKSSPQDLPSRGEFGGAGVFMIYLNDLELFMQYVREAVDRAIATASKNEKLVSQLDQLRQGFTNSATESSLDGVQNSSGKRVIPQARQLVTTHFKMNNYTSSLSDTPATTTMRGFIQGWRQLLAPLRQLLHPNVSSRILENVCRSVASQLEKLVWSLQSRLTEAGALLLDKDLNSAVKAMSQLQYSSRHRFAKVTQMVSSSVDETADITQLSNDEQAKLAQMRRSIRRL